MQNARNENREASRHRAAALRSLPLPAVLDSLGLDRDPRDRKQWRSPGHRISIDGALWYDHAAEKGGAGAIDLVIHLQQGNFRGAAAWLDGARLPSVPAAYDAAASAPRAPFVMPPAASDITPVRDYLIDRRGLAADIVDERIEAGWISAVKVGQHVNAAFSYGPSPDRLSGAELKGLDPSHPYSGLARGSRRDTGGFMLMRDADADSWLVLVESAIDAMSYYELHPDGSFIVMSTAGVRSDHPILARTERWVSIAYDNDVAGRKAAEALAQRYEASAREAPWFEQKDWNDVLLAQKKRAGG